MRKVLMVRRLFLTAVAAMACCVLPAQTVTVGGTVRGDMPQDLTLMLIPVTDDGQAFDTIKVADGRLSASVMRSPWDIYRIVGVTPTMQIILPTAIKAEGGSAKLSLEWKDGQLAVASDDADSKALSAFNNGYGRNAKLLWTEGKSMDDAALLHLVSANMLLADTVLARRGVSDNTAAFIRLWASVVTYDAATGLGFTAGRRLNDIGGNEKELMGSLCSIIDCDMAAAFPQTARMAVSSLPEGSIDERLEALHSRYRNEALRGKAAEVILSQFVSKFPYATRYDEGLAELTAVTEKYSLQQKYLDDFKARKASAVGNPFPDGVDLLDVNGNKVDFATFRGKYVYIDLWASWCVPCIREIPHLKQLEEELQNKDVVFLSVSIDRSEEAWRKKVAELQLKGNLLIDHGGKLANAMNVKGIPFFIIYDRDGRLYKYNAYRPSDPRLKPLLEGLK